jgi:hypothetical protein
MSLPSTSHSDQGPFVLDASAAINLLATGIAPNLLPLLGAFIIERRAFLEVRRHPVQGRDHQAELSCLIDGGHLAIQDLAPDGRDIFFELTADDTAGGLDDGEAATIALAITGVSPGVPVLDDRKAIKLLRRRWPGYSTQHTVSLLFDQRVRSAISRSELAEAVYLALIHARMRVPLPYRAWIVDLIGAERSTRCSSIGVVHGHTTAAS